MLMETLGWFVTAKLVRAKERETINGAGAYA